MRTEIDGSDFRLCTKKVVVNNLYKEIVNSK